MRRPMHTELDEDHVNPSAMLQEEEEELIYMSLLFDKGQLGVSIYDALTTKLKTLQLCISDSRELEEVIERLHTQFEVHKVLISSRNATTHGLLQIIKKIDQKYQNKTGISVRKHAGMICLMYRGQDFHYLKACQAIEQVRIGKAWSDYKILATDAPRREAFKYMGSFFDFESVQLIRATGALLIYLMFEKIGNQLDDVSCVYFSNVEQVALEGIMYIDNATFRSLQIFSREPHPSLVKGHGRAKEGFSLYGLVNRTVTKSGAMMLRRWMLAPLVNAHRINARLTAVTFFVDSANDELRNFLISQLKQFGDVYGIFQRIKRRSASVSDWYKLSNSITSFLTIRSHIESIESPNTIENPPSMFNNILSEQGALHVSNLLGNVIDLEESVQENTIVIRNGVSEVLDAARERYEDLDNVLTEVAFQIQESNPGLSAITVQYIPQVGYVICCDSPTALPHFVFQFQEDETTFYYKDACCRDLDSSIGDIFGFILDVQRELLEELTIALLEHESSIHGITEIMSQLDCFISFAECARNFNLTKPKIVDKDTMTARQARHPLQEQLVDHYIPNDVILGSNGNTGFIKIITGQNGSGKSVYLKMVGLLQYMTQIGCFVPAKEAEVGLVDKIFTRIQSMETATVSQSSFTIDCNQIAWMLNHGEGRSLFLIDEFGKGTAELDAVALLSAIINHLATNKSSNCKPRVIITTHLLEIFREGLLNVSNEGDGVSGLTPDSNMNEELPVACAVMATTDTSASSQSNLVAVPLYELQQGVSNYSNALGCAAKCGIPLHLIERAQEVLNAPKTGIIIVPSKQAKSIGPSVEEQLQSFFAAKVDWLNASDEDVAKFLTIARMIDQ